MCVDNFVKFHYLRAFNLMSQLQQFQPQKFSLFKIEVDSSCTLYV